LTGFSYSDTEKLKAALLRLLVNNESSARPSCSMEVYALYWWEHCTKGQYSPAKVHRSLKLELVEDYPYYNSKLENQKGLEQEVSE